MNLKDIIIKAFISLNISIENYIYEEIEIGYKIEKEHGYIAEKLNITNDDPVNICKIVITHLDVDENYYTKLKQII